MKDILARVVDISSRCTKYGMCKVDYLSTGLCPPAKRHLFASHFPQGRMEIATALYEGTIPVTEELVAIVKSCLLCNVCNRQCYFSTQLKPLEVMKALAEYVEKYLAAGLPVTTPEPDKLVQALANVVGAEWVSNDPAVVVCYSQARSPAQPRLMPRCVVLPGTTDEIVHIVRIANEHGIPVMPRGNGTSLAGVVSDGIILDLIRLDDIRIDTENWCAEIGAGVTAFDLQRAAHDHGLRANTAEPAAAVCANIISTNLHSLYSHAYGVGRNDLIDGEFVTFDGEILRLTEESAAGLMRFRADRRVTSPPAICTRMTVKLHPVMPDEDAVVVPFADFNDAVEMARELCRRRIGYAVGLLGIDYVANLTAIIEADAAANKELLQDRLGINYMLIVIGDRYALDAVRAMKEPVLDKDLMRAVLLGLPNLREDQGLELLSELADGRELYRDLFNEDMRPVLRMALTSTPDALTQSVDPDLRRFFTRLYSRPHMTDVRWLTTFRIVSARIGRGRTFVPRIVWTPIDDELISTMVKDLAAIGDRHGIRNGFGYLVPVELGKRAIFEFDYFYDLTSATEKAAMVRVMAESQERLDHYKADTAGIALGHEIALQGLSSPESYLFRQGV
jgi:hypothetical protein